MAIMSREGRRTGVSLEVGHEGGNGMPGIRGWSLATAVLAIMVFLGPAAIWSIAPIAIGPVQPTFARSSDTTPLVPHIISPELTDPLIDQALDDHYAWLDTSAPTNHQLFVLMPPTNGLPARSQLLQQEAARLGYHVIGLMYVDSFDINGLCAATPAPSSCMENAHFEVVYGSDASSVVEVNEPNSVVNRLTKLLEYLDTNYPHEGWSQFVINGQLNWAHIAVGGGSQGGANAAMIAKQALVPRVAMFSAIADGLPFESLKCEGPRASTCCPSFPVGDNWLSAHLTPSARYWALGHDRDPFFPSICASWESLGMSAFGPALAPETSAPPYSCTHELVTDLKPEGGYKHAHVSTFNDLYTPKNPDGTPTLADAWQYLMTAESDSQECS